MGSRVPEHVTGEYTGSVLFGECCEVTATEDACGS